VVANVTVQNLLQLLGEKAPEGYQHRVKPPQASGAFVVVYLGVDSAIPPGCPPHLQFLYDADGPIGRTIPCLSQSAIREMIVPWASNNYCFFVDPLAWFQCKDYNAMKRIYKRAITRLSQFFHLTPDTIRHQEAATPRTFAVLQLALRALLALVKGYPLSGFANRTPSSIYGW